MTHFPVLLELVVGQRSDDGHRPISLAEADSIAALAQQVGVTALRLLDGAPGGHTLDPTVVGAYLAGRYGDIGYLADIPTTSNAPYNVARRVLSADRATAGRFGVALRVGGGARSATRPCPIRPPPIRGNGGPSTRRCSSGCGSRSRIAP
jgi:alkanesulfonate monooxygenase SsuD/methylene tetrahydromethanopterin reductase-like flavin-dependent oxidoreductase (luciferase family)